jgi:hypothetical protein
MITKQQALERLQTFRGLNRDWDSYGAEPIEPRCIEKAKELIVVLPAGYWPIPKVDGGVALERHVDGFDITIEIDRALWEERDKFNQTGEKQ